MHLFPNFTRIVLFGIAFSLMFLRRIACWTIKLIKDSQQLLFTSFLFLDLRIFLFLFYVFRSGTGPDGLLIYLVLTIMTLLKT